MAKAAGKYKLLTRSDFDGLVAAILLNELRIVEDIKFVQPNDVQNGRVPVDNRTILTNLPYVDGCYLCFDHHLSEEVRAGDSQSDNFVLDPSADSAARVVFEYFGGFEKFSDIDPQMMNAVDKADAARFNKDDITNPQGWELLSFIMDPRTGLSRFDEFDVSHEQLMMDFIDHCRNRRLDDILELPEVKQRIDFMARHHEAFLEQLRRCSTVHANLVVLDFRGEEIIYPGNRFVIYTMYPQCNISIHVIREAGESRTNLSIGKSIINKKSKTNVGRLALQYGGGGHAGAGGCKIPHDDVDRVLGELIEKINADG